MTLLQVDNLAVDFQTYGGTVQAVRGVSFDVESGETLAIVGESGCGKSVTVQALMDLIPRPPGNIRSGQAWFEGEDLLQLSDAKRTRYRGRDIGMIFQDPMTSLNPTMTIGQQIAEPLRVHRGLSPSAALESAIDLLKKANIPEAERRASQYPFEFSGGMLQRAQILALMSELKDRLDMAIILITHDLAVVAKMADRVCVMYAGQIVERGSAEDIFYRSRHPYTLGLKQAMPSRSLSRESKLAPIPGSPPDLFAPPKGCGYAPRCPHVMNVCVEKDPPEIADPASPQHTAKCWLQHQDAPTTDLIYQPIRATEVTT
ncbi:MAG: ABC transporter ATP-binding protein [Gammaproteobacteria bacterium]|nr:ABC transporter ATP-binding protein [Gammaproteobacteria bacterium]